MTTRAQHITEMRFALAHKITLPEAKRRLARQRQIAADEFRDRLNQCGTDARRKDQNERHFAKATQTDARWMMRD